MAKKIRQEQIEGSIVNSIIGSIIDNTDPKNPKIDENKLSNLPLHGLTQNTKTAELFTGDLNTLPNGNYSLALHSTVENAPHFIGTPRSIIVFGNASGVEATVGKIIIGSGGIGYKIGTSNWVKLTTGEKSKVATGLAFTGTTNKTLTITFDDGSSMEATFTDLNTTYSALTAQLLNAGTSTTAGVIAPKVIVDYINSRLGSIMRYKGQVNYYSELPTSGNELGDVWNILNANKEPAIKAGDNVAWNGTAWDVLSGFIDTSAFLTKETDPKGVQSISVTGTTNKTITITLRDGSTVTGTFTDKDTTYTVGTLSQLEIGTDTTGMLWKSKDISDFVRSLGVMIGTESHIISKPDREIVAITLIQYKMQNDSGGYAVFLNGVKQPFKACEISGGILRITQSMLPTPIIGEDEVEILYKV